MMSGVQISSESEVEERAQNQTIQQEEQQVQEHDQEDHDDPPASDSINAQARISTTSSLPDVRNK